jgi:glycine C-acetyltransferase
MASLRALELLEEEPQLLRESQDKAKFFREGLVKLGFKVLEGNHPIVPLMLGDANVTQEMSKKLLEKGLFVVGLWFPVVPEGHARLRFQVSSAHTQQQLERALKIVEETGKEMGLI